MFRPNWPSSGVYYVHIRKLIVKIWETESGSGSYLMAEICFSRVQTSSSATAEWLINKMHVCAVGCGIGGAWN
jgi:hypothetical protein